MGFPYPFLQRTGYDPFYLMSSFCQSSSPEINTDRGQEDPREIQEKISYRGLSPGDEFLIHLVQDSDEKGDPAWQKKA